MNYDSPAGWDYPTLAQEQYVYGPDESDDSNEDILVDLDEWD